ncbi:MAG TPA: T9SS type A sorting domain-containing protein [Rhodothermales bacterium]|nr:T9SS type A sorting domain-containing protein [Rhodothermales bacterium]
MEKMKAGYVLVALIPFVLASLHAVPVHAQNGSLEMLVSSSAAGNQEFGGSLDLDGSVAVIGAARDDDGFTLDRGAAFVFRYDGDSWSEEAMLMSSTPSFYNYFGSDVAISGDVILVSEIGGDALLSNAGNVNVFRYSAGVWEEETVLTPPTGIGNENFGSAVDVDGQVAAVSAPRTTVDSTHQGAVHVYRNSGSEWTEEAMLTASDPGISNLFGASISIDGDRMLIGAFNATDSTSYKGGKVYIFDFDGENWSETAILQSNRSNNLANMGVSVGLDGNWAVSGANVDNEIRGGAGAAIVHHFDGANWNFHSKLTASDGQGFFMFGSSVAVEGTVIAVGATNWAPPGESSSGKVYLFTYDETQDTWIETAGLVPENTGVGDKLGRAVAIGGGVILAGAPDFGDPGAAFVYGEPRETTAIEDEQPTAGFQVSAAYPNPFNSTASLTITPDLDQSVSVALYDVLGRKVRTLFEGRLPTLAPATIEISAGGAPNGLYLVRIESESGTMTRSVMLIR